MTHPSSPLPPGTQAPEFELRSTPDQTVSLGEFRGRPVILVFYPEDWSPVARGAPIVCLASPKVVNNTILTGATNHVTHRRRARLNGGPTVARGLKV